MRFIRPKIFHHKPARIKKTFKPWWEIKYLPWFPLMIIILWMHFAILFFCFRTYLIFLDLPGVLVDPSGIAISTAEKRQYTPSVAFDGANYLVVWRDTRNGSDAIYGARASPSGIVLDEDGIIISSVRDHQNYPILAFDGDNYLVVWADSGRSVDYDIYGVRISPTGTVLDPRAIAILIAKGNQYPSSIAFDGDNYLVVWADSGRNPNYDVYGVRISPSGEVLDQEEIVISKAASHQFWPSVAFDGTNYLVVWRDERKNMYGDIYGARVTRSGRVLDPPGIPISMESRNNLWPSVVYGRESYLVVWKGDLDEHREAILGARVSTSGTVIDASNIIVSAGSYSGYYNYPCLSFGGTTYLVVWQDGRWGSYYDIYGARISSAGIVLDTADIAIAIARFRQGFPKVAFDGSNFLVVWMDERAGEYREDIYGARVAPTGIVLDGKKRRPFEGYE